MLAEASRRKAWNLPARASLPSFSFFFGLALVIDVVGRIGERHRGLAAGHHLGHVAGLGGVAA